MWTPATRRQHSRAGLRYASDLTDAEWAVLAPLLPPAGIVTLEVSGRNDMARSG